MHWVQRMLRSSMRDEPEAVRLTETHGRFKKERGQLCPRVDLPHFPKRADKAVRAPFVRFLNPPWEEAFSCEFLLILFFRRCSSLDMNSFIRTFATSLLLLWAVSASAAPLKALLI